MQSSNWLMNANFSYGIRKVNGSSFDVHEMDVTTQNCANMATEKYSTNWHKT